MAELTKLDEKLGRMHDEAAETEQRCTQVAATDMMSTYLGDDADGLDGFEFLTMAEAGEVGHWAILGKLNEKAGEQRITELVEWALPIQKRHFSDVKDGSLKLAADEDPSEASS